MNKTTQNTQKKSKKDEIFHDLRNILTVMKLSIDSFEIPYAPKEVGKKVGSLIKILNKEISRMKKVLKND